jgi:hypothetical protein
MMMMLAGCHSESCGGIDGGVCRFCDDDDDDEVDDDDDDAVDVIVEVTTS